MAFDNKSRQPQPWLIIDHSDNRYHTKEFKFKSCDHDMFKSAVQGTIQRLDPHEQRHIARHLDEQADIETDYFEVWTFWQSTYRFGIALKTESKSVPAFSLVKLTKADLSEAGAVAIKLDILKHFGTQIDAYHEKRRLDAARRQLIDQINRSDLSAGQIQQVAVFVSQLSTEQ